MPGIITSAKNYYCCLVRNLAPQPYPQSLLIKSIYDAYYLHLQNMNKDLLLAVNLQVLSERAGWEMERRNILILSAYISYWPRVPPTLFTVPYVPSTLEFCICKWRACLQTLEGRKTSKLWLQNNQVTQTQSYCFKPLQNQPLPQRLQ